VADLLAIRHAGANLICLLKHDPLDNSQEASALNALQIASF
jgi:hypothetical protein